LENFVVKFFGLGQIKLKRITKKGFPGVMGGSGTGGKEGGKDRALPRVHEKRCTGREARGVKHASEMAVVTRAHVT
jgi:hypothetical protein